MTTIKRVYEPPTAADGHRVLVDRLWPRGLARARAGIDEWAKAIAPSTELRLWYGHEKERWPEFRKRYRQELAAPAAVETLERLRGIARRQTLTLLTATRADVGTHAHVLAEMLARGKRPARAKAATKRAAPARPKPARRRR
ncbi:MAG: DUF488 family protein [Alphaproteobacteria bacterium]|nr:DUF488 family protein [Alphaproteobacteria bacterium]